MNVRGRIGTSLTNGAAAYAAYMTPDKIYENSAEPSAVVPMFAVLRYGGRQWGTNKPAASRIRFVDFWVHDAPGTYDSIEDMLRIAHPLFLAAVGPTDYGYLSSVEEETESEDAWDDATQTIARYRTYRLVGSGV